MFQLNKNEYLDKLHACWLGKNIGGTMGAPYEGTRKFLDIKGFATPGGEPMPNDDLDLQLVWLVLEGYDPSVEIEWDEISLQDMAETARAELYAAQAAKLAME